MSTYTLESFARAIVKTPKEIERFGVRALAQQAEFGRHKLADASKASGGVDARLGSFKYLKAGTVAGLKATGGNADQAIIKGSGFAVLDEYGSGAYDISPRKSGAAQRKAKRAGLDRRALAFARSLGYVQTALANKGHGDFYAAGTVHHPGQQAHPYVAVAVGVLNETWPQEYNLAVLLGIKAALP